MPVMTFDRRRFFALAILALLMLSALVRVVSASLGPEERTGMAPPLPVTDLLCPPSDKVATLLGAIAARDGALAARERAVALREQDIRIATQEVRHAMGRLEEAKTALAARMHASDVASEQDVSRLVAVYEGMKPKEAAALFETMESGFAAGFLARMRPEAASAVFSKMSPERGYALSAIIAGRNAEAARGDDG